MAKTSAQSPTVGRCCATLPTCGLIRATLDGSCRPARQPSAGHRARSGAGQSDLGKPDGLRGWPLTVLVIGQLRSRTRDYVEDAADGSTIEIVRRGRSVARMEPARLSTLTVMLLLDALFGGSLMHCLTTPPSRTAELADNADAYTAGLVDFVLASVTGPTSGA